MNKVQSIISNMEKIIVGKKDVLEKITIALLTNSHVLIEDVPGVGKTQCVGALAKSVNGIYNRVQFTPDVMASDITGFTMYNPNSGKFQFKRGASYCNFLLADEINRASAKTQSSLLEVMEENQVTVDGVTYRVPQPFMVLATQNPVESKGTNKLPEAQMDRFLFKLSIGYPSRNEEKKILDRYEHENPLSSLDAVASPEDILAIQKEVKDIKVVDDIKYYILSIIDKTRKNDLVTLGVSPRGGIALLKACKAFAYLKGRTYVIPDDVQALAVPALSHRLMISSNGRSKGYTAEQAILDAIKSVPVTAGSSLI